MKTIDGTADSGSRFAERRMTPRFRFNANADMADPVRKTHTSGRVTEIGQRGCFVEVDTPPPVQSVVQVRIHRDETEFKSWALVVYQRTDGIGLHFLDTAQDELELLIVWLKDLKGQSIDHEESTVGEGWHRKT